MLNIWDMLKESFDSNLPRLYSVMVKAKKDSLGFYSPSGWDKTGYSYNFSQKTTYDNMPVFDIDFALYSGPDTFNRTKHTRIIYKKCLSWPSYIKREFRYTDIGLSGTDEFGMMNEGSATWRINLKSMAECFDFKRHLYTVVMAEDGFDYDIHNDHIFLNNGETSCYIACNKYVDISVYYDDVSMMLGINTPYKEEKKYTEKGKRARYIVFDHCIDLKPGCECEICFGFGESSGIKAVSALNSKSIKDTASDWNKWFNSLPKPAFYDQKEMAAYYKCWRVIRENYYTSDKWGHSVLECLPVYKGIWQWAMPAVEWYSDQDTYMTSIWFDTCRTLFTSSQREDGYIPLSIFIDEEIPGERWSAEDGGTVQTPQFPWVALRNYYVTRDLKSLEVWYEPLIRYYKYLCMSRDMQFRNIHLWAVISSNDSGMDTFPALQKVAYGENGIRERYCYPAIFAAERQRYEIAMARICEVLGFDPQFWYQEADKTKLATNEYLWDENKKWYGVLHENNELDTRIGLDALFLAAYGLIDKDNAILMEANFLKLIGNYGLRTVAVDEPGYVHNSYWRGPAWPQSCSIGMQTCQKYYPHISKKLLASFVNMVLVQPNIWECYISENGDIAKCDQGFICTPGVSSNVGAGGILGSIFIGHGFDMYGIDDFLPLNEMTDFHWAGMRITIIKADNEWRIIAKKQEKSTGAVHFISNTGLKHELELEAGDMNSIAD